MSWLLDDIDFADYGVKVRKSQGVLDMPALADEGYNWLDENGRDYWQDMADCRFADREIVLWCYLKASSYTQFKSRLNSFTAAIKAAGKRWLTTPFGTEIECYVKREIAVERQGSYVKSWQLGLFTLYLTVPGDTRYKVYPIYHASGAPIVDYLVTDNLRISRSLQGDSYATCTVEKNVPLTVDMYAYIMVNTNGLNYEPYYFMHRPEVAKASTNKFTYNLRLEHGSILLKQSRFLNNAESDFPLYADLETLIGLVCDNADRFIPGKFTAGTIDATTTRLHTFKGEDCLSVVKRLAQEYELEYDIRFIYPGSYYVIDIRQQIAATKEVTLEYGKGKGLYELRRGQPNRDNLGTVLYAYGAAKNLKPDYRGGKRRLEFDGNPLRKNDETYMGVEKDAFFDDIYPRRTGTVTGYTQVLKDDLTDEQKEIWPGGIYQVIDTSLDFDLNDYLLGGLSAKIHMNTGSLAGFEFEIARYEHTTTSMYIIPFKDERGAVYPSALLQIAPGDEYVLVDIDQPESYVAAAEAELEAAAGDLLDRLCVPDYPYDATVDPAFLATIEDRFEVGDRVTIKDTNLAIEQLYRITQLVYHAYTGMYELSLSEFRQYTKRERQQIVIDKIVRTIEATNAQEVETIRKDQETTNELRNRLLDPITEKLQLDTLVRHESIDPGMLAFDAGVPQFFLKGMMVEANYGDDPNKVYISSGYLIITNYYTECRYDIKKKRDEAIEYDPSRSWFIQGQTYDLSNTSLQYAYVKINLDINQDEGEIIFDDKHIEVKRYLSSGYLYYKLGYLTAVESPRGVAMLWGNVKQPSNIEIARSLIGIPKYGSLYNEDALTDERNICAPGWHVPTLAELEALYDEVNNGIPDDETGMVLKSLGLQYWAEGHTANDRKGFDLRGTGKRNADGTFEGIQEVVHLGSTTSDVWTFEYDNSGSTFETVAANVGRVLRPIADTTTLTEEGQTGWYTGNDGKIYRTRLLYGVEWVVENVSETYYQDGSPVEKVEDAEDWAALESGAWCVYDNDDSNSFTNGKISDFVEAKAKDEVSVKLDEKHHNELLGLQGGDPATLSYFHLSKQDYNDMKEIISQWLRPEFIFSVQVGNDTVTLPLVSGYTYDFYVDWGDGSAPARVTAYNDVDATHTYTSGIYDIKITGTCQAFSTKLTLNTPTIRDSIIEVKYWGQCDFRKIDFAMCSNLISIPTGWITGSPNLTTLEDFLNGCELIEWVDASSWDLTKITNINNLFGGCESMEKIDCGNWDVSNVTQMKSVFGNCTKLINADVGKWNVGKVVTFEGMFYACKLETIDVADWDVSAATNMDEMFCNCNNLRTINVGQWNMSNVQILKSIFRNCVNLETIDVSSWDISSVTDMDYVFSNCAKIMALDVGSWDVSSVQTMKFAFAGIGVAELAVEAWNISNVADISNAFGDCTELVTLITNNWDTTNITNCTNMCYGCANLLSEMSAVKWWSRSPAIPTHVNCFSGCTNIYNYNDIPSGWK